MRIALLFSCLLFGHSVYAVADYQLPNTPLQITPIANEAGVAFIPTFSAGEFSMKDATGAELADTLFSHSDWLITDDNQIALIGGNSVDGSQRDEDLATTQFDTAEFAISLSGSNIAFAKVNHKRLELLDSNERLLGYVALPAFIYQADNKDKYQAVRYHAYDDGDFQALFVQWQYGDDDAVNPWRLKIEAQISNNSMYLAFDSTLAGDELLNDFGSEEVILSGKAVYNGHSLSSILTDSNAIRCDLFIESADCQQAVLPSNYKIIDLSIIEVEFAQGITSLDYRPDFVLAGSSDYYWRLRHTGKVNGGENVTGNWTNTSKFTTAEAATENNLELSFHVENLDYVTQIGTISVEVKNNSSFAASNVFLLSGITTLTSPLLFSGNDTFMDMCISESESFPELTYCYIPVIEANSSSQTIEFDVILGDTNDPLTQVCTQDLQSCRALEAFPILPRNLNALTEYDVNLTVPPTVAANKLAPISMTMTNTSGFISVDTVVYFDLPLVKNLSIADPKCEQVDVETVRCVLGDIPPGLPQGMSFNIAYALEEGVDLLPTVVMAEICELDFCDDSQKMTVSLSVTPELEVSPAQTVASNNSESSGGLFNILGFFLLLHSFRKVLNLNVRAMDNLSESIEDIDVPPFFA